MAGGGRQTAGERRANHERGWWFKIRIADVCRHTWDIDRRLASEHLLVTCPILGVGEIHRTDTASYTEP